MEKYAASFIDNGYDNVSFIGGGILTKEDLHEIGIEDPADCSALLESLKERSNKFQMTPGGCPVIAVRDWSLDQWLESIQLVQYRSVQYSTVQKYQTSTQVTEAKTVKTCWCRDKFLNNMFSDMERVAAVWDDELLSIVEIEKIGHRKRMLLSVAGTKGIDKRFGKVNSSVGDPEMVRAQQ